MENNAVLEREVTHSQVITSEELLSHWQNHRKLTRRVIEAFPEDKLFNFSIGGMRTFAMLAVELLDMGAPTAKGIATNQWNSAKDFDHVEKKNLPTTKLEILDKWDQSTAEIDKYFVQIAPERFHDRVKAFEMYEDSAFAILLYVIDNEIHHRGQGYVYLRALGIEPPPFWDRY